MTPLEQVQALWKYELAEMCFFTKRPSAFCTSPAVGRDAAVSIVGVVAFVR